MFFGLLLSSVQSFMILGLKHHIIEFLKKKEARITLLGFVINDYVELKHSSSNFLKSREHHGFILLLIKYVYMLKMQEVLIATQTQHCTHA